MADEPSWDELFTSQPGATPDRRTAAPATGRIGGQPDGRPDGYLDEKLVERRANNRPPHASERRSASRAPSHAPSHAGTSRPPRRRRRLGWLWALVAVLAVLGIGAAAVFFTFETQIRSVLSMNAPVDFTGTGTEDTVITITDGQVGGDVASTLVDAGVTKTYQAFYGLLLANPDVSFQPGSYKLKKEMSAQSALDALMDPASKVFTQVVIPEGTTLPGVLRRLAEVSEATGVTREQLDVASLDLASFGLPAEAPSLEGYLFPATYSFDPGLDAHALLQRLVDEMLARLDALGVAPADRHRVLTLAALTQKEGGSSSDFFKVARVWENRIEQGMNLQSDATVSYGSGGTTIATSDEERADASNPYNTYANPGLPIGPISNPGEDAIRATLAPEPGPWLFFVLINGNTGETAFSTTFGEHNAAVKVWQQWLRDNPDFEG